MDIKPVSIVSPLNEDEYNELLRQAVAVLPWSHNLILMGYDLSPEYIVFYANEVVSKGWSRDMLKHALKSDYHLSIQAVEQFNNFTTTLPAQQAEYANEVFRSSYNLSFIDAVEPLKAPNENPSIGIILCAEKDRLEVELALQNINKPIGVAEYQSLLPKNKLQELITAEINK